MKKLIFLFALITNFIFSQNETNNFNITLKTGVTFANMYGKDVKSETFLNGDNPQRFYANNPASDKLKTGNNLEVVSDYRFGKYFSLGLGLGYIQKGARINATRSWNSATSSYDKVSGTINWVQNYWSLNIPASYYFPIKQGDFYIQGGLFFARLNNSKEKGNVKIANQKYSYERSNRGANKNESGYFFGIGYLKSLKNTSNKILVELIWSRSASKSFGANMVPSPQIYHNQTTSLNVGIRHSLKKKAPIKKQ